MAEGAGRENGERPQMTGGPSSRGEVDKTPIFHALVLGGGESSRMGEDKALLAVGSEPLLKAATLGALAAGAQSVGVIAPEATFRELFADAPDPRVWRALEDPPHGGPLAGVAAGFQALSGKVEAGETVPAPFVAVLACDLPGAPTALQQLTGVEVDAGTDGVVAVDEGGWDQPLLALYETAYLGQRFAEIERETGVRNVAARRLFDGGQFTRVALPAALTRDVDTRADIAEYALIEGVEL